MRRSTPIASGVGGSFTEPTSKTKEFLNIIDKSENWAEKDSVIAQKMLIEIVQEHIKKEDYSNLKKFCDDYLDSLNKNLEKY